MKKGGMREGKERTNRTEVQEEECEGKSVSMKDAKEYGLQDGQERRRNLAWGGKVTKEETGGGETGPAKKGISGKYWKGRKKGKSSNCI